MTKRIAWLALAAAVAGCGEYRPKLYPATGQLFVDGKAAPGAVVSLHPVDGKDFDRRGARPTARVREDGTFTLSTYTTGDGTPPGEYRVCVTWFDSVENPEKAQDRLGLKYARETDSTIVVRIGPESNELEPIRIEAPPKKK